MTDVLPTIDFSAPAAQAHQAAKEATKVWVGHVTLGTRTFQILPKVPTAVSIEMDAAQESGDADRIVNSLLNILRPEEREAAQAYAKADTFASDDDIVSLGDLVEALQDAQEQMAARPTKR